LLLKMETKAVHAGRGVDPATGAVTPPIHLSTTFERDADGGYPRGYEYTRESNPNRDALEECVRELEGGAAAAAFSSGMAATMTVLQTLAPGDHVVVPDDTYFGTREIFRDLFSRWGVETSFVDMTNAEEVGGAVRPSTRLFWVETPSNPRLKITDVREISGIAREAGALLACDNTWATPVLQRPLELGADLVMHATTKYLGGHSDVMGGVVARSDDGPFQRIRKVQHSGGAIPSPFECWLTLRGIQTLPYRMRAHSENAARVGRFLDGHPAVAEVFYPGLESHPGHGVASEQMSLFGGMLSFLVRGDREHAMAVAADVRDLLRLSVGLEHPDDLTEDLARALGSVRR
jgi:cystathionine gamma-synthase